MAKDPNAVAQKYVNRLGASLDEVRAGVNAVSEAPTEKAADALPLLLRRLQEAIESGRMEQALRSVSLQDWKNATLAKVDRIPAGARAAMPKLQRFFRALLDFQSQHLERIRSMPKGTLEDSIARSSEWIRTMSQFKKPIG